MSIVIPFPLVPPAERLIASRQRFLEDSLALVRTHPSDEYVESEIGSAISALSQILAMRHADKESKE